MLVNAVVGGKKEKEVEREVPGQRRVVTGERMQEFRGRLDEWDSRVLGSMGAEENVARFWNEFQDILASRWLGS